MIRCTFTLQSAAPRTTPSKRCRRPANGTAAAGSGVPPSTSTRVSCCPANSHFPTRIDQWGELAGWAAGVRGRPSAWMADTTGPPLRPLLRGSTSWGVRSVQATITSGGCCAACAENTRATWRLSPRMLYGGKMPLYTGRSKHTAIHPQSNARYSGGGLGCAPPGRPLRSPHCVPYKGTRRAVVEQLHDTSAGVDVTDTGVQTLLLLAAGPGRGAVPPKHLAITATGLPFARATAGGYHALPPAKA